MKLSFHEIVSWKYHALGISNFSSFLALAWLAKSKANVVIPENQPLPKYLRKKTSKSAKYRLPLRYKKDPLK